MKVKEKTSLIDHRVAQARLLEGQSQLVGSLPAGHQIGGGTVRKSWWLGTEAALPAHRLWQCRGMNASRSVHVSSGILHFMNF